MLETNNDNSREHAYVEKWLARLNSCERETDNLALNLEEKYCD